jgi:hypothetical protein
MSNAEIIGSLVFMNLGSFFIGLGLMMTAWDMINKKFPLIPLITLSWGIFSVILYGSHVIEVIR